MNLKTLACFVAGVTIAILGVRYSSESGGADVNDVTALSDMNSGRRAEPHALETNVNGNNSTVNTTSADDPEILAERVDATIDSSVEPGSAESSLEVLRALHALQKSELQTMQQDLNAVVIDAVNNNGIAITLREIRQLHADQSSQFRSSNPDADVVDFLGEDSATGVVAVTVSELRSIHDMQQRSAAADVGDEYAIVGASGSAGITVEALQNLHSRQSESLGSVELTVDKYFAAPLPDAGDSYLVVDELHHMHESQLAGGAAN